MADLDCRSSQSQVLVLTDSVCFLAWPTRVEDSRAYSAWLPNVAAQSKSQRSARPAKEPTPDGHS